MKKKYLIGTVIVLVIAAVIVGGVVIWKRSQGPGKYDGFAQCLEEQNAVFYGAFWCPHCTAQKNMFGSSKKLLPYVECSTPDRRSQVPYCTEREITSYPTWEFADGSRETGTLPIEALAEKTGCELPSDA